MDLEYINYDIIFQNRLLNNRDEENIVMLLDGPDGKLLNAAISSFIHTKKMSGLVKMINLIENASDRTRTNIYAAIPYIDLQEWKTLVKDQLKKVESDTKSTYLPLRNYSEMLIQAYNSK